MKSRFVKCFKVRFSKVILKKTVKHKMKSFQTTKTRPYSYLIFFALLLFQLNLMAGAANSTTATKSPEVTSEKTSNEEELDVNANYPFSSEKSASKSESCNDEDDESCNAPDKTAYGGPVDHVCMLQCRSLGKVSFGECESRCRRGLHH